MDETQVVIEIPQAAYQAGEKALNDAMVGYASTGRECVEAVVHAAFPIALAAAYTDFADQLTELAEHIRNVGRQTSYPKSAPAPPRHPGVPMATCRNCSRPEGTHCDGCGACWPDHACAIDCDVNEASDPQMVQRLDG